MRNYRIQLASNYQVVEFNLELDDEEILELEHPTVASAISFINALGEAVINNARPATKATKEKPEVKKQEMATEGQVKVLVGKYGYSEKEAKKFTKQEAWKKLKELKEAEGD